MFTPHYGHKKTQRFKLKLLGKYLSNSSYSQHSQAKPTKWPALANLRQIPTVICLCPLIPHTQPKWLTLPQPLRLAYTQCSLTFKNNTFITKKHLYRKSIKACAGEKGWDLVIQRSSITQLTSELKNKFREILILLER